MISFDSFRNTHHDQELKAIESEKRLKLNLVTITPRNYISYLSQRDNYDELTSEKVAQGLTWTKQSHYHQGRKQGKYWL